MPLLNRLASLTIALLLALAAGCGAGTLDSNKVSPDGLVGGNITREELLSDLEALQPSSSVNAQDFAGIKGALKAALIDSSTTKFTVHPPHGPNSTVTDLTLAILPDGSSGIQWTYVNPGDYNFDGQTNLHDLVNLGAFLGSVSGDARWDKAQYVDGDSNGAVTIADITPIAVNFLGTVTAYQVEGAASEEGSWERLQQIPYAEGNSIALTPPLFDAVADHSSYSYFRVSPLDVAGDEGSNSSPSRPVRLKATVHAIGYGTNIQLVSREGNQLILSVPGGVSIKPGDCLLDNPDSFLVRVDEVVAGENTITANCSPATLESIIDRGVLDIDLRSQDSGGPGGYMFSPFVGDGAFSFNGGDVTVDLGVEFNYHMTNFGRAQIAFGPDGVARLSTDLSAGPVDVEFAVHIEGNYASFPSATTPSDFERVIGSTLHRVDVDLGGGLVLPLLVGAETLLGFSGGGTIDGDYRLSSRASFVDFENGLSYDANDGWTHSFAYMPAVLESDPQTTGSQYDFEIHPYIRTTYSVELLRGNVPAGQPIVTLSNELHIDQAYFWNGEQAGYDLNQIAWGSAKSSGNGAQAGLPSSASNLTAMGTFASYSSFIPFVTYAITGMVVDTSTHTAMEGVSVFAREIDSGEEFGIAVTDAEGKYLLSGIPPHTGLRLTPYDGGLHSFVDPSADVYVADNGWEVNFVGYPSASGAYGVSGYLLDFELGTPIVGAVVNLYDAGGMNQFGQTETDSAGHYSFAGLSPFSTVRVVPNASGYGFMPSFAEFTVTGEMGQDFTGYLGGSG